MKTPNTKKNNLKNRKQKGASKTKKCSPYSSIKKVGSNTCLTPDVLEYIKTTYNKEHKTDPIGTTNPVDLFQTLKSKYQCNEDLCWIQKIHDKTLQKKIKTQIFAPEKPAEWKKNPNEWLSNFDILDVLRQYEVAYPHFRFIEPSPIDFNDKNNGTCISQELCSFHLTPSKTQQIDKQQIDKQQIGIIFNLDKHDEPGSHWVSMYIDIDQKKIYYFDSASTHIPKEIAEFKDRLLRENPDFKFLSNSIDHQQGNTECGMYSLYFIIQMLLSKNRLRHFQTHFNNKKKKNY